MLEATNWKGLEPYFREGAIWGEKQDIGVGMHWYSTCMNVRVNMKAANSNHVYYECKICSPFFVKFSRNATTSSWSAGLVFSRSLQAVHLFGCVPDCDDSASELSRIHFDHPSLSHTRTAGPRRSLGLLVALLGANPFRPRKRRRCREF